MKSGIFFTSSSEGHFMHELYLVYRKKYINCLKNRQRKVIIYIFTVDKQLYEECEIDGQCNAISGKEVCREIRDRKLCLCEVGFIEDNTALKCLQGKISKYMVSPTHPKYRSKK